MQMHFKLSARYLHGSKASLQLSITHLYLPLESITILRRIMFQNKDIHFDLRLLNDERKEAT